MKITFRQIAAKAGVSLASVSRYYSRPDSVSEEVSSKIEDAIEVLGGANSRRAKKKVVLILLMHMRFTFFYKAVQELLEPENSDYTFIMVRYDPKEPEITRSYVRRFHPVGAIYFEEEIDNEILTYIKNSGARTVMCGGMALNTSSDMVRVNDLSAAYAGANYLLDLGHRNILFLSDEVQKISAGFQRITGCRQAMEERGLSLHPSRVCYSAVTFQAGYDMVQKAVADGVEFTAVFAFSDELAVGAMAALYDLGYAVPDDVSVMGYDDLDIAIRVRPKLTTIRQPIASFVKKTLELFEQPTTAMNSEILLPYSIVERDSCKRIGDPI